MFSYMVGFSFFDRKISVHIFMQKPCDIIKKTYFVCISACGPPITIKIHQPTIWFWNVLTMNAYSSCCWLFNMVFEPAIEQFVEIAVVSSFALIVEDTLVFALLKFLAVRHWCAERVLLRTLAFDLYETPIPFSFECLIEESFSA